MFVTNSRSRTQVSDAGRVAARRADTAGRSAGSGRSRRVLAGPVIVTKMPPPVPTLTEELFENLGAEIRRELIGALLAGRRADTANLAGIARRWCAERPELTPQAMASLLAAQGVEDVSVVLALWWVSPEGRVGLVRHLLRVERWSGPRVIDALRGLGLGAAERCQLLDPTVG